MIPDLMDEYSSPVHTISEFEKLKFLNFPIKSSFSRFFIIVLFFVSDLVKLKRFRWMIFAETLRWRTDFNKRRSWNRNCRGRPSKLLLRNFAKECRWIMIELASEPPFSIDHCLSPSSMQLASSSISLRMEVDQFKWENVTHWKVEIIVTFSSEITRIKGQSIINWNDSRNRRFLCAKSAIRTFQFCFQSNQPLSGLSSRWISKFHRKCRSKKNLCTSVSVPSWNVLDVKSILGQFCCNHWILTEFSIPRITG
jgi:hypothetical protein